MTLRHIRLYIYRWKTKFSSHRQYPFDLVFWRNAKKSHTDQSILQTFLLCVERNNSQTFKSNSFKKVFLKCIYHSYNLLQQMFFIACDNSKTLFFIQIYFYLEVSYNRHVAAFFETSVLKEVCILYLLTPQ